MNTRRGPYKQYQVNGSSNIPRRTNYRKRLRLLVEVDEQIQATSRSRRALEQVEVCLPLFISPLLHVFVLCEVYDYFITIE